jgi:hypothetical protein
MRPRSLDATGGEVTAVYRATQRDLSTSIHMRKFDRSSKIARTPSRPDAGETAGSTPADGTIV